MTTSVSTGGDVSTAHKPIPPVRERIEGAFEDVREKGADLYQQGRERARKWEGDMENRVREHPVQSVLVAAGVGASIGLVLGVLLARR